MYTGIANIPDCYSLRSHNLILLRLGKNFSPQLPGPVLENLAIYNVIILYVERMCQGEAQNLSYVQRTGMCLVDSFPCRLHAQCLQVRYYPWLIGVFSHSGARLHIDLCCQWYTPSPECICTSKSFPQATTLEPGYCRAEILGQHYWFQSMDIIEQPGMPKLAMHQWDVSSRPTVSKLAG